MSVVYVTTLFYPHMLGLEHGMSEYTRFTRLRSGEFHEILENTDSVTAGGKTTANFISNMSSCEVRVSESPILLTPEDVLYIVLLGSAGLDVFQVTITNPTRAAMS